MKRPGITDNPLSPPRPPRTKRGAQKAEKLRQVAAQLFLAHGFDGVSIDEIVRVVGGSKTNVYSYFGSKERLFVTVVDELCEEFLAPLAALDVTRRPLQEGLRELGRNLLGVLLSKRHLSFYRLIIAESGRFPDIGEIWRQRGPDRAKSMIDAFISRHVDRGRFSPRDTLRIARLFHDMITGSALEYALTAGGEQMSASELDRTIAKAAEFVAGAIEDTKGQGISMR
jgi:AcrR family transcriptional regulator